MRAIILAAGRGRRMGHLGDDRPKCLVELAGKPLIERQIAALRRGGVDEIGVVRGYRAETIDFPGLFYFANERWAETNMVMSLAAAAAWLRSEPVIVSYADIFYRSELVRGLADAEGELVVSYDRAWRRLWARRFNQSAALANVISRASGVPVAPAALARVKATVQQVGLTRAERAVNVQGAFRVPEGSRAAVDGRRLVLVDDVLTTGATIDACARVLLRAGAAQVDVLVFARVVDPARAPV